MPKATRTSARRLGAVPLSWHGARWWRHAPGPRGLALLGALTVAMAVPLERLGVNIPWQSQAQAIVTLAAFAAAAMFGRDLAASDDIEPWLVMLGHSPADWALARYGATLLPLIALTVLWSLVVAVGSASLGHGISWTGVAGLAVHLALTVVVITSALLVLGAAGVRQTAEVGILLMLASVLQPLLADSLPALVEWAVRAVLPPLPSVAEARAAVFDRRWHDGATALLHVGTWCALAHGIAVGLLARRLPR